MKKVISFLALLLFVLSFYTPVLAASVPAQTFPGNDANAYTPPKKCIHYQIPNSDTEGSHTVNFDSEGNVDPDGPYSFTVTTGTIPGNEYTQVLSWSSNFPIYAVIVKGGDAFNLYQYEPNVRKDTDLVSPDSPSGNPADVSHVSVVICPDCFPPKPPTPTPTPEPTATPTPLPCPPCPPCPCHPKPTTWILIVNTIFQIISTILLGVLVFLMFLLLFGSRFNIFGSCIRRFHKKSRGQKKPDYHDKEKDNDKKEDKDCDHNKDKDCHKKDDKDYHSTYQNGYCKEKYDPSKGYSLDCNNKNTFPYYNKYF